MKDVTIQQFEKSFSRHYATYKTITPANHSAYVLLFYAVECGLKSLIMKEERVFLFSKLSEDAKQCKHDVKKMLKILGIEASYHLETIKTNRDEVITSGHYNEYFRYGMECKSEELVKERIVIDELQKIADWIKTII